MSVMTVRYRETLHRTVLFLRRTLSDVLRLFETLLVVTKGHTHLKVQALKELKLYRPLTLQIYTKCLPMQYLFLLKVLYNWLNKIPENRQILKGNFRCLCQLVIFLLHFNNLTWLAQKVKLFHNIFSNL